MFGSNSSLFVAGFGFSRDVGGGRSGSLGGCCWACVEVAAGGGTF